MKRYVDQDKLLRVIDKAMFDVKTDLYHRDKKAYDVTIQLLDNFKYLVKTMECIEIVEKGDI